MKLAWTPVTNPLGYGERCRICTWAVGMDFRRTRADQKRYPCRREAHLREGVDEEHTGSERARRLSTYRSYSARVDKLVCKQADFRNS